MDDLSMRLLAVIVIGAAVLITALILNLPKHTIIIEATAIAVICVLIATAGSGFPQFRGNKGKGRAQTTERQAADAEPENHDIRYSAV